VGAFKLGTRARAVGIQGAVYHSALGSRNVIGRWFAKRDWQNCSMLVTYFTLWGCVCMCSGCKRKRERGGSESCISCETERMPSGTGRTGS